MGIKKVSAPKTKLLFLLLLNSCISISSPARNIMYNNPVLESNSKLLVDSIMWNEWGPIIIPEMMSPIIPGTLKRLNKSGENKIMSSVMARISTGFFKGRY